MFLTVRQQLIVARAGFTYDVNNEHMQSFLRSTSFPHVHPPLPPGSNPACGQEKPRQTGGEGAPAHSWQQSLDRRPVRQPGSSAPPHHLLRVSWRICVNQGATIGNIAVFLRRRDWCAVQCTAGDNVRAAVHRQVYGQVRREVYCSRITKVNHFIDQEPNISSQYRTHKAVQAARELTHLFLLFLVFNKIIFIQNVTRNFGAQMVTFRRILGSDELQKQKQQVQCSAVQHIKA